MLMNVLQIALAKDSNIVSLILLTVFTIMIWTVNVFALKKVTVKSLVVYIINQIINLVIIISSFFAKPNGIYVLLVILMCLSMLVGLTYLVLTILIHNEINQKTTEYLKNNEYDFFIQMNQKEKITDCSNSLLKFTKLSKKEVLHNHGWKFIFDSFDVKTLNKQEFSLNYVAEFLAAFKECTSKHKCYRFQMEVEMPSSEHPDNPLLIRYDGIIQPVFIGQKLLARNIYFYQDKTIVVEKLKSIVKNACLDLDDAYLQLDMMMSMSEGVIMYYDFQNKVYVATDSMLIYTNTTKKEYSFEELFELIHKDDVNNYISQAETVNSVSITKINYRMKIGDRYYQVEEDSIYMRKDYGLISILRISEQQVYQTARVRSDFEVLDTLNNQNIKATLEKTEGILDTILGEKKDEDD